MIEIGKYNNLEVLRHTSVGIYLGDTNGEDVLLPNKYCLETMNIGDMVDVFVYLDHEERKVATTISPKIILNTFSLLRVSAITQVGAFMDWGLEKELLVPFKEQLVKMEENRSYIVYLALDEKTNRLFASNRCEKWLQNENLTIKVGDEVDILFYQKSDMGFSVIINNIHKGLVFSNEIFANIKIGDKTRGFVKKIREDNKIDISLQAIGYSNSIDTNCDKVYAILAKNNGFMPVTDKTNPDEIYSLFGLSKKTFKRALGSLYKDRIIEIQENGIKIIE